MLFRRASVPPERRSQTHFLEDIGESEVHWGHLDVWREGLCGGLAVIVEGSDGEFFLR